jgi:hypothetical protein
VGVRFGRSRSPRQSRERCGRHAQARRWLQSRLAFAGNGFVARDGRAWSRCSKRALAHDRRDRDAHIVGHAASLLPHASPEEPIEVALRGLAGGQRRGGIGEPVWTEAAGWSARSGLGCKSAVVVWDPLMIRQGDRTLVGLFGLTRPSGRTPDAEHTACRDERRVGLARRFGGVFAHGMPTTRLAPRRSAVVERDNVDSEAR